MFALLGLAGTTTATIAGWLAPVFLVLSLALVGRAHWILYAQKKGNRVSVAITWTVTLFVAGFWSWKFLA